MLLRLLLGRGGGQRGPHLLHRGGLGILRKARDEVIQFRQRLLEAVQTNQVVVKHQVDRGDLRIHLARLCEVRKRARIVLLVVKKPAQLELGKPIIGLHLNAFLERLPGLLRLVLFHVEVAEIGEGGWAVLFDFRGFGDRLFGLGKLISIGVDGAEAQIAVEILRIDGDGFPERLSASDDFPSARL